MSQAEKGNTVKVHYTGTLTDENKQFLIVQDKESQLSLKLEQDK